MQETVNSESNSCTVLTNSGCFYSGLISLKRSNFTKLLAVFPGSQIENIEEGL